VDQAGFVVKIKGIIQAGGKKCELGAVSSLDKFHIKRYKNHPISPIGIVGIFSEILNEFLDSLTFFGLPSVGEVKDLIFQFYKLFKNTELSRQTAKPQFRQTVYLEW
ncbi:hypothetical protein U3A58_13885, partial [Algoriphagus sp. C2-6-M1]|uniref:hypothetical protein n=1 Tax=Algoriphagus persicinus TaxID=3108754 RepID=UPI002B3E5660